VQSAQTKEPSCSQGRGASHRMAIAFSVLVMLTIQAVRKNYFIQANSMVRLAADAALLAKFPYHDTILRKKEQDEGDVMNVKILIADDEDNIREVVQLYLEKEGFTVFAASDGEEALDIETRESPDLLILDIMLPKMSGWEICRNIERQVPVIFLTAKTAEADKMTGFSLGADDYVTKPFSPRELVARVKAVLRRSGLSTGEGSALSFNGLTISPADQTVTLNGHTISLTPKEYDLLLFLIRHPHTAFSREQLLVNVWGYDFDGDERTVDATVKRLRQKLHNNDYDYVHTVWGLGYKFEVAGK
jgi:DNA-binding response OmpR family regulator